MSEKRYCSEAPLQVALFDVLEKVLELEGAVLRERVQVRRTVVVFLYKPDGTWRQEAVVKEVRVVSGEDDLAHRTGRHSHELFDEAPRKCRIKAAIQPVNDGARALGAVEEHGKKME